MKTYISSITISLIIITNLTACSQQFGIVKASAYARKIIAGTIQTDEFNRQRNSGINTVHLIFVETKSNNPSLEWTTAWIDQKAFLIKPVLIHQPKIEIGKSKDDQENVVITPSPGNRLWQLVLSPASSVADTLPVEAIKTNAVVLTGKWKNKKFIFPIAKEEQLASSFSQ
jgi:hypothetical protein